MQDGRRFETLLPHLMLGRKPRWSRFVSEPTARLLATSPGKTKAEMLNMLIGCQVGLGKQGIFVGKKGSVFLLCRYPRT